MHKQILVGLDGSKHAIEAAQEAIALAKASDAGVKKVSSVMIVRV